MDDLMLRRTVELRCGYTSRTFTGTDEEIEKAQHKLEESCGREIALLLGNIATFLDRMLWLDRFPSLLD